MIASEDRNQIHPAIANRRRYGGREKEGGRAAIIDSALVFKRRRRGEGIFRLSFPPSLPDAHFISCGICTTHLRAGLAAVRKRVTGHLRCPINNVGPLLSGSSHILTRNSKESGSETPVEQAGRPIRRRGGIALLRGDVVPPSAVRPSVSRA